MNPPVRICSSTGSGRRAIRRCLGRPSRGPKWRHCPCWRVTYRGAVVHRYYDPVTGQFLSVDPLVNVTGTPYVYTSGDAVNLMDPLGLGCGIFSVVCDVGQAVEHHLKTIVTVVAITAAVASVALTAGADIPALAAAASVTEGLDAASIAAGATDFSAASGATVLGEYAANVGTVGLFAGGALTVDQCYEALNAQCGWDAATLGLGYGFSKIPGLLGSLLSLAASWPSNPFTNSSTSRSAPAACDVKQ